MKKTIWIFVLGIILVTLNSCTPNRTGEVQITMTASNKIMQYPDLKYKKINPDKVPYKMSLLMAYNKDLYNLETKQRGYNWFVFDDMSIINIGVGPKNSEDYAMDILSVKKNGNTVYIIIDEKNSDNKKSGNNKTLNAITKKIYPRTSILIDEVPEEIVVTGTDNSKFSLGKRAELVEKNMETFFQSPKFKGDLICTKDYGKFGFIDKTGKKVVDFKYDYVGDFQNGIATVGINGKYGIINKLGKEVLPVEYDQKISFEKDTMALLVKNDKYGLIDNTGNLILECKYDKPFEHLKDGVIKASFSNKNGLIKDGQILAEYKYETIEDYDVNGMYFVTSGNLKGAITKSGIEIISPIYKDIRYIDKDTWRDRIQLTLDNGLNGICDFDGNILIPIQYTNDIIYYDTGTALFILPGSNGNIEATVIFNKNGNVLKY